MYQPGYLQSIYDFSFQAVTDDFVGLEYFLSFSGKKSKQQNKTKNFHNIDSIPSM